MCVQNYQCDEGIILRYVCWATWDPIPAAPQLPPFTWPKGLGMSSSGAAPGLGEEKCPSAESDLKDCTSLERPFSWAKARKKRALAPDVGQRDPVSR